MQRSLHAKLSALVFVTATGSMVAIGCSSSSSGGGSTGDAGFVPDAQFDTYVADAAPDVAEAAVTEAGQDAVAEASTDAPSNTEAGQDAAPNGDGGALAISPTMPTAKGCSTDVVTFTASGGTPPYTWTTSQNSVDLPMTTGTSVTWEDNADDFCGKAGTATVTVTDSVNATATATITVTAG